MEQTPVHPSSNGKEDALSVEDERPPSGVHHGRDEGKNPWADVASLLAIALQLVMPSATQLETHSPSHTQVGPKKSDSSGTFASIPNYGISS